MTSTPWNPGDELLTLPEVAASLRMSLATIQRWCRTGHLPAAKAGKAYRVRKSDLDNWYEHHRTSASLQR